MYERRVRVLGDSEPIPTDAVPVFGPFEPDPEIDRLVAEERVRFLAEEAARERGEWPVEAPYWQDPANLTTDEEVALAMGDFYDKGYDGHIPTYEEEALVHYQEQARLSEQAAIDSGAAKPDGGLGQ